MITLPHSYAALTPALLARKGGARPAQRISPRPLTVEDIQRLLDVAAATEAPVAPALPVAGLARPSADVPLRERAAAFTLRIAPERHRRLRLACMLADRSAQVLITEAIDHLLATVPGLESIAPVASIEP
ncbi:hypothetical protein [Novosphingobium sp.]|uniref:hypothetical protein n=1 Tax=Novosphingobium sp. TaxID=1874826 RepID=UPI0038BD5692